MSSGGGSSTPQWAEAARPLWSGEEATIHKLTAQSTLTTAKSGAASLPVTSISLYQDLQALGLLPGMTVIVHSSLSGLGWVCGGPLAVVYALQSALGLRPPPVANTIQANVVSSGSAAAATAAALGNKAKQKDPKISSEVGTLVMPAHSSDNSEPSYWVAPPIPSHWHAITRAHMTPFDPYGSPTRGMGRIAECFRTMRCRQYDVRRSNHPAVSFTAQGPNAVTVTANHSLSYGMADNSPLGAVYQIDATYRTRELAELNTAFAAASAIWSATPPSSSSSAASATAEIGYPEPLRGHGGWILLLGGVGHDHNSSLHLAEHRAQWSGPKRVTRQAGAIIDPDSGQPVWQPFDDWEFDDSDFLAIGAAFEAKYATEKNVLRIGKVGAGRAVLMRAAELVDFAQLWMAKHRTAVNSVLAEVFEAWPSATMRVLIGEYVGPDVPPEEVASASSGSAGASASPV